MATLASRMTNVRTALVSCHHDEKENQGYIESWLRVYTQNWNKADIKCRYWCNRKKTALRLKKNKKKSEGTSQSEETEEIPKVKKTVSKETVKDVASKAQPTPSEAKKQKKTKEEKLNWWSNKWQSIRKKWIFKEKSPSREGAKWWL